MINLLSPPTDNLYKFIAIAGLVLLVSAIFTGARQIDLLDRQFALRFNLIVAEAELSNARWDAAVAVAKEPNVDQSEFQIRITNAEQQLARLHETGVTRVDISAAERIAVRWFWGTVYIATFGLIVMVFGFIFWYTRLQRHQDQILIAEARKGRQAAT